MLATVHYQRCQRRGERHALVRLGLLLLLVVSAAAASNGNGEDPLSDTLEVERQLLERARARHERARNQQTRMQARVLDLEEQLDVLLASDEPSIPEIERLVSSLAAAVGTSEGLVGEAALTRREILDHLARIDAIEATLRSRDRGGPPDPLSGTWIILVRPSGQEGRFELELEGAIVRGEFELDGGFHGSLRGTFINRRLQLERIDRSRGLDVTYEGFLSEDGGRIDGRWRSTRLDAPGAAGGQWRALRPDSP